MKVQVESPEKNKRKRRKMTKNASLPSSSPSFSLLPDEIIVDCLARISRSYYPKLSIVSKSFRSLVSSTELYVARSHLRRQCLYVCLWDNRNHQLPQWFTFCINPNRTVGKLVAIPTSNFPFVSQSTVSVGSEIFVIGGGSSAVRVLDCRGHSWCNAPSMNVARMYNFTCVYDGKIYVFGGVGEDKPWAEVFNTKTRTWECLPEPGNEIRECYIIRITEIKGKIYFGCPKYMYAYDPKQGKWERCENKISATFLRSGCVIETVSYSYVGQMFWWSKNGDWAEVKGLDSLREKLKRNDGSPLNNYRLVGCDGKLLFVWEWHMKHNPSGIWCAEIAVEKRGGDEVWGKVEWVDVVHTVPKSCHLRHCLVVSV